MLQLRDNLDLALELSTEIIRLAREEAWSDMEQLDRQRMQILESVFSHTEIRANPQKFEDIIQQLVELNDQAIDLCAKARGAVIKEGQSLKQGREAIAAYRKQSYD